MKRTLAARAGRGDPPASPPSPAAAPDPPTTADDAAEPTATTSVDADAFPVTIEHAFGETTIEAEPTRVATLGWTDQDSALALGVVPVGATKITWGGNEAGSTDVVRRRDRGGRRRGAGEVRRRRRRPDRRDRRARARPDPGDQLRHHRGGVRQALQDRAGRRLPRGAVDHRAGRPRSRWSARRWAAPRSPRRSTAETEATIDEASAANPELEGAELIYGYLDRHRPLHGRHLRPGATRACPSCATSAWSTPPRSPTRSSRASSTARSPPSRPASLDSDVFITWVESPTTWRQIEQRPLVGADPRGRRRPLLRRGRQADGDGVDQPRRRCRSRSSSSDFLPHVVEAIEGA